MLLAGSIFACLIGIIYLLWNQRTMQKEIDTIHNTVALIKDSNMPPLDEVIAHYEQKLSTSDEMDAQDEQEQADDEVVSETQETIDTTQSQMIDLSGSGPSDSEFDITKFHSIRVKDLKEQCRQVGFSPKGTKTELVTRLLKHPTFNTDDDLVEHLQGKKLQVVEEESEHDTVIMEDKE